MIQEIVLDTSVLIKWFRQSEVLADRALALRAAYLAGQIRIWLPTLATYELANVLRYKRDLTTQQVQDAVQSLFDMEMEWIMPSDDRIRRTVEIARTYNITVYDATFIATAEALSAICITADQRLARGVASLSFVQFLGDVVI